MPIGGLILSGCSREEIKPKSQTKQFSQFGFQNVSENGWLNSVHDATIVMISDILKLREISGGFKPGQPDRQCYHLISLGKNIPIYQPYASPALKTQVISDVNCYEIQNHPAPPKRMVEPL